MERHAPTKQPQQLSPAEWESLIDDFQSASLSRRNRWYSLPIIDLAVSALVRRDFPSHLKTLILLLLEDSAATLVPSPAANLPILIDSLRSFLLSPSEPHALKDQAMVSTTSIVISTFHPSSVSSSATLESLTEVLLLIITRPSHGPDRAARATACECLRELELAYPCLLSDTIGQIYQLAQAERTHAAQYYLLLLATIIHNIVKRRLLSSPISILSTSTPLVPFNAPKHVLLSGGDCDSDPPLPTEVSVRDVGKVVAFLLERPQALTPAATMELVSLLVGVAAELELMLPAVVALLKVQFSGLIHSYDPVLCHAVLMLYSRFAGNDDARVFRRLALVTKETHNPLVFRLLALHWILGLTSRNHVLAGLAHCFYPLIFDPLSLKLKKLDCLACIAASLDKEKEANREIVVKLLEDGLVCLSNFRWLPPWSSETAVAFRTYHKFLIEVAPHAGDVLGEDKHGDGLEVGKHEVLMESTIFRTLQDMMVNLALEHHRLVPVIVNFMDRFLGCSCKIHRQVGERLLQTLDEQLLPKFEPSYQLVSYFSIFERIAESRMIPPSRLLKLLTQHMIHLTKNHGPDTGLRSWSQGSKVLGICRTMLAHHHSSSVFHPLSNLLAFSCKYFPELEVRDNARIYLRMLLCIPGKKLRHILELGEQLPGVSSAPHTSSFFQISSPRSPKDLQKSPTISSVIHLERVTALLVKQSWSLALPSLGNGIGEANYFGGIKDVNVLPVVEHGNQAESDAPRVSTSPEPLRVVDSDMAQLLQTLRRHFASIPDYRYMPGVKINIHCILRFEADSFARVLGADTTDVVLDGDDGLPALYATSVSFSSTSKYGHIPSYHVPFLLGEPTKGNDIVPAEGDYEEDPTFRAPVMIELEPREAMPGLINVNIIANVENGQIISGSLQDIQVGIEDMFLKVHIPYDVPDDEIAAYCLELFHALWEACGNPANTGREVFPLCGGKGAATISGTQSVKLLDIFAESLISSVERHMAIFVVSVSGESLVSLVKRNGRIRDIVWDEEISDAATLQTDALVPFSENASLQLDYNTVKVNEVESIHLRKRNMGNLLMMIFLPPRYHLLLQLEVDNTSTLVRIRTDYWPSLAYIDEYLESVFYG